MELPAVIPNPKGIACAMLPADERSILDGLRELNPQVIGAVYDQFYPQVYRYILYRIGDETTAEDLASDVFVRLLEASQQGRGPQTNLKGWLISTAAHVVTDQLRRRYRRPLEALSESFANGDPEPHAEFDLREQNRLVRQALARLTPEQQHVLALRFGQGFSLEETAQVMKKNINAVKALQFRALAALQRQIGEVWNE
jgi:RNA polymerase sigma-70 factor (ECF subfamily)